MKFQSTVAENFESWERFLDAYYEPIRVALGLIPFVGEADADDLAQSFFLKMYERDILEKRPAITGKFRNWLYIAARHHAIDEWRKTQKRPVRLDAFDVQEPADSRSGGADASSFDADELYALSVLHMTVKRVRKHLIEEGKSEHWMIFEELVLAPLAPGRATKTRDEILAMFPGQDPVFLDNRITTVKRVFRRILPVMIPTDPTASANVDERFTELLGILRASSKSRLWLAFLANPAPGIEESTGSSIELADRPTPGEMLTTTASVDVVIDELRVLLSFWLETPLHEYLDDLEDVGPSVAAVVRASRPARPPRQQSRSGKTLNLNSLIARVDPRHAAIPSHELALVYKRIKSFAKKVHRALKQENTGLDPRRVNFRENSMPVEVAQVLYDLAGALALRDCDTRIIGLTNDRFRKNLTWVLSQSWIDTRLRPIFSDAIKRLG